MAVVTKVIHISDVSGEQIEERDLQRAEITWKGTTYRLSVTKDEYKRVEEYLDDLVEGSEEVEPEITVTRARSRAASSSRSNLPAGHTLEDVREWARSKRYEVKDRGRIAKKIEAEYKQDKGLSLDDADREALAN